MARNPTRSLVSLQLHALAGVAVLTIAVRDTLADGGTRERTEETRLDLVDAQTNAAAAGVPLLDYLQDAADADLATRPLPAVTPIAPLPAQLIAAIRESTAAAASPSALAVAAALAASEAAATGTASGAGNAEASSPAAPVVLSGRVIPPHP